MYYDFLMDEGESVALSLAINNYRPNRIFETVIRPGRGFNFSMYLNHHIVRDDFGEIGFDELPTSKMLADVCDFVEQKYFIGYYYNNNTDINELIRSAGYGVRDIDGLCYFGFTETIRAADEAVRLGLSHRKQNLFDVPKMAIAGLLNKHLAKY